MSQLEPMMTPGSLPPSRHRRSWGKIVTAIASVLLVVAMIFVGVNLLQTDDQAVDFSGTGVGEVTVVVSTGDTLGMIGNTLEKAGVVLSRDAFVNAAAVDPRASTIGPGRYTLRKQMSAASAIELMLDPQSRASTRLVIPEGLRLEQMVETASAETDIPKSAFQKALRDPVDLGLPDWAKNRPEGFMFPATYDLIGEESAKQILTGLVTRFNQAADEVALVERAAELGLDPYDVLVVASLLEAEVAPEDFRKAAAVIYNRLKKDMPLQLDSTVSYALGVTEYQLSDEQLKTKSPYNTYLNKGLPPGPINSPGEAALEAALSPAKGKWLYFVAVDPRTTETKFAKTYEEFLALKEEFRKNLAEYEREQAQGE